MEYQKVPKRQAETVLRVVDPEWKRMLRAGDMLLVDKRPNWSIHEPTVLRSKTDPDGKGIYIWLDDKPPKDTPVKTDDAPVTLEEAVGDLVSAVEGEDVEDEFEDAEFEEDHA